jgi:hypothetical protein
MIGFGTHLALAPREEISSETAVGLLEEWPGEMIAIVQAQLPSNLGGFFSTKAR